MKRSRLRKNVTILVYVLDRAVVTHVDTSTSRPYKRGSSAVNKEDPWGWELILDCFGSPVKKIKDEENIREFIKALVKNIDMVAYGEPFVERFATHDEDKAGISFCQMIETSNITGHFAEKTGDFYINIFSCKTFDPEDAIGTVYSFFGPANHRSKFIERG